MSDRTITKKGLLVLLNLIFYGIVASVIPLKLHYTNLAWIGAGILVFVVILLIMMQINIVGWKGLTKERTA